MSNIFAPETTCQARSQSCKVYGRIHIQTVVPNGIFSSSPVPSSYLQVCGSPAGTRSAYKVVTLGLGGHYSKLYDMKLH